MALQAGAVAHAPAFKPHVTLLGGIEATELDVMTKADALARQLAVRGCAGGVLAAEGGRDLAWRGVGGWEGGPCSKSSVVMQGRMGRGHASDQWVPCSPFLAQQPTTAQPYDVEFEEVGTGTFFFQCVLIKCKQTPAVMAAAQKTREAFATGADAPYFPHLSLLYADISPDVK